MMLIYYSAIHRIVVTPSYLQHVYKSQNTNTSYAGHGFGALAGLLIGVFILKNRKVDDWVNIFYMFFLFMKIKCWCCYIAIRLHNCNVIFFAGNHCTVSCLCCLWYCCLHIHRMANCWHSHILLSSISRVWRCTTWWCTSWNTCLL